MVECPKCKVIMDENKYVWECPNCPYFILKIDGQMSEKLIKKKWKQTKANRQTI